MTVRFLLLHEGDDTLRLLSDRFMRSSFSLPLAGAAAITVGAVVFGLLRIGGRQEAAPAAGAAHAASPSLPDPASLEANLLDRLRSRGF